MLGYGVAFPTAPGQDDGSGFVASVVSGSIASADGNAALARRLVRSRAERQLRLHAAGVPERDSVAGRAAGGIARHGPPTADWWKLDGGDISAARHRFHGGSAGLATWNSRMRHLPSLPGTGARLTLGVAGRRSRRRARGIRSRSPMSAPAGRRCRRRYSSRKARRCITSAGPVAVRNRRRATRDDFGLRAPRSTCSAWPSGAGIRPFHLCRRRASSCPEPAQPGNYYHAGLIARPCGARRWRSTYTRTIRIMRPRSAVRRAGERVVGGVVVAGPMAQVELSADQQLSGQRRPSRLPHEISAQRRTVRIARRLCELRADRADHDRQRQQTGFVDGFFLPQANDAATLGRQNQYASLGDLARARSPTSPSTGSKTRFAATRISGTRWITSRTSHPNTRCTPLAA